MGMTKPTPTTPVAEALSAALGFRRVVRPTSEQMLKAMAQAADEQRRVLAEAEQKIGAVRSGMNLW